MENLLIAVLIGMWTCTGAFQLSKENVYFKFALFVIAVVLSAYGVHWLENN